MFKLLKVKYKLYKIKNDSLYEKLLQEYPVTILDISNDDYCWSRAGQLQT